MRIALATLVSLALVVPASAMMAPEVYEGARDEAPSVIVISVHGVERPKEAFGTCMVNGTVEAVERGEAFAVGDLIGLGVDCAEAGADYPDGGTIWEDMPTLMKSQRGRAWLDEYGYVTYSQYEVLE